MNSDKLTYLPKEFKDIFKRTNKRLHEYGEVFTLVKFSFITTMIIFAAESDEEEFEDVKKCRKIISDYLKNEEFLQSKVAKISDNHQYYIESFYKQGIIYLWSSLEIFIKELIEELIKYDNCYLSNNELSKIKIPMTEYFSFSDEDKISYLAALVIEKSKSTYLRGVDKFEGYLSSFNLNGSVDSKHKTNIYIIQQIRNCIVHNDSIVDKKFYENCKQLGYEIGDEIKIDYDQYRDYEVSVEAYIMKVFLRLNRNFGAPERFMDILKERIDKLF